MRKATYFNIVFTYAGLIALNCIALIDLDWGTQLYISAMENVIIAIVMIIVGLWEIRKCDKVYLNEEVYKKKNRRFNLMSGLEDEDVADMSKTKERLLAETDKNSIFLNHKFEELIHDFGGRMCKSFGGFELTDRVSDPREVKTWPCTPDDDERGTPEQLPDPYPDNVYSLGLTQE